MKEKVKTLEELNYQLQSRLLSKTPKRESKCLSSSPSNITKIPNGSPLNIAQLVSPANVGMMPEVSPTAPSTPTQMLSNASTSASDEMVCIMLSVILHLEH